VAKWWNTCSTCATDWTSTTPSTDCGSTDAQHTKAREQASAGPLRGLRIATVPEVLDVLRAHGYQRPEGARGLLDSLRALHRLIAAFEDGR
jgi:hypothetical protein